MSKQTGGPAFPVERDKCGGPVNNGMTLRDYFAAKAMAALTSAPIGKFKHYTSNQMVVDAYTIADAMIEERDK